MRIVEWDSNMNLRCTTIARVLLFLPSHMLVLRVIVPAPCLPMARGHYK